jgi:hypothetical protein
MNNPKTQFFGPGDQPFRTQDALLAACLYFAGVPFFEPLQPCVHRYNADILKRFGYSGIPLEEAAKKAHAEHKRGNIEYLFKRPKELRDLIKAFHEEEQHVTKGSGTAAERLSVIMALENIEPEERIIRIACLLLKMRLQFMRLWETQIPRLRIQNVGAPEDIGDGITRYPGWKEIPLNASDELKKKMGLN